ncbi:MAG: hypothetical protein H6756_02190 [Candidatus Omnitrophica bacterium]|nr:hypothetical protein [Candidatus Omnitrophota bacterium]
MNFFSFRFLKILAIFPLFLTAPSARAAEGEQIDLSRFQKLIPLHEVKLPPGEYDWMAQHPEPDQSFYEYVNGHPVRPDDERKYIYLVLLGEFDPARQAVIRDTARYIEAYFQLETRWLDPVGLDSIPPRARRVHPQTGDKQILTSYVLEDILTPNLPDDAVSLIAFTSSDLWPGEGWNFVFGQASITDRVGVWSIYRNGNPNRESQRHLCLLRTVKTGTHELGHMFSLHHCPYFECNMNGANHRQESDRRPLWLCPVCLAKLTWNLGVDPAKRYRDLIRISDELGLEDEKEFFEKSLDVLEKE